MGIIQHTDATPEVKAELKHIAFIPDDEPLSLTKPEKLRTTALLFAIQHVEKTICNDAQMYQALKADGKTLVAASVPYVIESAINFEAFLLGRYSDAVAGAKADAKADRVIPVDSTEQDGDK